MTPRSLLIWGAGGHAAVVAEAVHAEGAFTLAGYIDDTVPGDGVHEDQPRLRPESAVARGFKCVLFGFGHRDRRLELASRAAELGMSFVSVIHPRAWVAPSATVARGTFIGAMAVVNARARIGAHAIINTGAIVEHDCEVGAAVHISPGARCAGRVTVGDAAWIGIGATIIEGVRIGAGAIIGAGAVVVQDIPAGMLAYGVPARVIRPCGAAS